jgi:hypothetical protein
MRVALLSVALGVAASRLIPGARRNPHRPNSNQQRHHDRRLRRDGLRQGQEVREKKRHAKRRAREASQRHHALGSAIAMAIGSIWSREWRGETPEAAQSEAAKFGNGGPVQTAVGKTGIRFC